MMTVTLDLKGVDEEKVSNFVIGESFISEITDDVEFTWDFIKVNLAAAEEYAARDAAEATVIDIEGRVLGKTIDRIEISKLSTEALIQRALIAELDISIEL